MYADGAYIRAMRRPPLVALAAGLLLQAAALAGIAALNDAAGEVPLTLALFAAAAAAFLVTVRAARRIRLRPLHLLLFAVLLRAPLVPVVPSLSDDVWRYLHDGRAQVAGTSPYAFAPAAPETEPFRGPWHERINHPDLVTIYPPFAQLGFLLGALLGGTLFAWKLMVLAADLLVILLILRLLRERDRPPALAALYAWNPLVILEVAGSAHLEPLALAPLLAAFLLAGAARPVSAGAALGLSVATKYFAAPIAPFLLRERVPRILLGAAIAIAAVSLPYVIAGPSVFGSLGLFGRTWSSNAGPFALLALLPGTWTARILVALLLGAVLLFLWRTGAAPVEAAFVFFFATLLLSPVVHPWYLLWIVALLPLAEVARPVRAAALAWSLTAPAAYLAIPPFRATGEWAVPVHALLVQYVPVLVLLGLAALNRRTAAARSATPSSVPAG